MPRRRRSIQFPAVTGTIAVVPSRAASPQPAPPLAAGEPQASEPPRLPDRVAARNKRRAHRGPDQEARGRAQYGNRERRLDRPLRAAPGGRGHGRPLASSVTNHGATMRILPGQCGEAAAPRRPSARMVADAAVRAKPGAGRAGSRRTAAAQSSARAHRRGRRGRAHGGPARADPRARRGPAAAFRGEHAAAHGRRQPRSISANTRRRRGAPA